jgi:hypothetical protein
MYKFLLIDDDQAYCRYLQDKAEAVAIELVVVHHLEAGIRAIENDPKIAAVILDGHCPIDEHQPPETAKSNFVSHAIHRLTDIEHIHNRFVPFCINTHKTEDFREDLEGITLVFQKNMQEQELLRYMIGEVKKLPQTIIYHEYEDIFVFFENYFSSEDEELLLLLLQKLDHQDFPAFVAKLNMLRRLEERLFDVILTNYYGQNPATIISKRVSRTKNTIFRLKNQRKLPLFLFDFAMDIYSLSSRYGAHSSPQYEHFTPSVYTLNSLVFAFLELCKWAEHLIESQES